MTEDVILRSSDYIREQTGPDFDHCLTILMRSDGDRLIFEASDLGGQPHPRISRSLDYLRDIHRRARAAGVVPQTHPITFQAADQPIDALSVSWEAKRGWQSISLVPDFYYYEHRGYEDFLPDVLDWEDRADVAIWRGSTTGLLGLTRERVRLLPRYLLCRLAAELPDCDVGFTSVIQAISPEQHGAILADLTEEGLTRDFVPMHELQRARYVIDIDGNANSWNFLEKLRLGACLLRVESSWQQWFESRLTAWRHYVPIAPDLSNLAERLEWLRAWPAVARDIARQGREMALGVRFDEEMKTAGRILFGSPQPGSRPRSGSDVAQAIAPPRYVAAFRTYTWDEDIAELARRFFAACPSARKVVLADETRGKLPIPDTYEVISHTTDTSLLGVPDEPKGSSLWYNVDYGVYFLREALPDFEHYVLSESDLAVNLDIDGLVAAAVTERLDLLTHDIRPSDPIWVWHASGAAAFANPLRSLLCFMVLSGRAIDHLLATRQRHGAEFASGALSHWPFCEPFVPSALRDADMSMAELSRFADTQDLNYRPRISIDDVRVSRPGSLVHSVLGRAKYVQSIIDEAADARDALFSTNDLAAILKDIPLAEYASHLLALLGTRRDHAAYMELAFHMKKQGLPVPDVDAQEDLAFCRPALASSTSDWSRHPEPYRDAAGANGIDTDPEYGFHTDRENSPWWMVDLGSVCEVKEVRIVDRPGYPGRFVNFVIESSGDAKTWANRFAKLDLVPVSADVDAPHVVDFVPPFEARFVRLRSVANGVLHLRRVQVMGRRLEPTGAHLSSIPV